jgi:hypothetical protein
MTFNFGAPACAGGSPGKGDSGFFFGLVSAKPPASANAAVEETGGATHGVKARAAKE